MIWQAVDGFLSKKLMVPLQNSLQFSVKMADDSLPKPLMVLN